MKDTQELRLYIVPNVVNGSRIGALFMLIAMVLFISLYGTVRGFLAGTRYYPLSFLLLGPVILYFIMFLLAVTVPFWVPKEDDPVAILNKDGLWHYRFGFIPWNDVSYFGLSGKLSTISVRVKDNEKISKQASFTGKFDFFWAKLFGHPPIRIVCIVMDKDYVVSFAKQFLNN